MNSNTRQFDCSMLSITRITIEAADEVEAFNLVQQFLEQPNNGGQLVNVAPNLLFAMKVYEPLIAAKIGEVPPITNLPSRGVLPGQLPHPFPYTRPELVTL